MKLAPLKKEHFQKLSENECIGFNPIDWTGHIMQQVIDGICYALIEGDEVFGIGGVSQYWDHVGEGWVLFSKNVITKKRSIAVLRLTKQAFLDIMAINNLHRVTVYCRSDNQKYWKFVEFLGFRANTVLAKHFPDGGSAMLYEVVI